MNKTDVANIVKKWLEDEGHKVQDFQDENSDINYLLQHKDKNINISFPKSSKDKLVILGKIAFSQDDQNKIKYLKINEETSAGTKIALLQSDLSLHIIFNKNISKEYAITDIVIQKYLYFDGLTKNTLYDRINVISNCFTILMAMFQSLVKQKNDY